MAVYNTPSDAANTAVRSLLTKIGEYYWESSFNTGSGKGKKHWEKIRDIVFEGCCAYCGDNSTLLQIEHLIMFNREQYGLHHPGNIVPVCKKCNKRTKLDSKKCYADWEEHLEIICRERNELDLFFERKKKIKNHIEEGVYKYPSLNEAEMHSIQVIANSLYENIKAESDKSLRMYEELDKAFIKR